VKIRQIERRAAEGDSAGRPRSLGRKDRGAGSAVIGSTPALAVWLF